MAAPPRNAHLRADRVARSHRLAWEEVMSDLQATALDGNRTVIERKNVETFAASLRGALLEPGQPGYDEGRLLWNGMMDKRPALIARCEGVADVIAAVNFARDNNILLAVRGGGHNVAGFGACDG